MNENNENHENNENENYINPVEIKKDAPKSKIKTMIIIGVIVAILAAGVVVGKSFKMIAAQFSPKTYLTYVLTHTADEITAENSSILKNIKPSFTSIDFKNINKADFTMTAPSIPDISGGLVIDIPDNIIHSTLTAKDLTAVDLYENGTKGVMSITGSHNYAFPLKTFGDDFITWATNNLGVDPAQYASFKGIDLSYSSLSTSNTTAIKSFQTRLMSDTTLLISKSTVTIVNDKDTINIKGLPVSTKKVSANISVADFKSYLISQVASLQTYYKDTLTANAGANQSAENIKSMTDKLATQTKQITDAINAMTFTNINLDVYAYKNTVVKTNIHVTGTSANNATTTPTKFDDTLTFAFADVTKMLNNMSLTVSDNVINSSITMKYTGDNFTTGLLTGSLDLLTSGVSVASFKYSYNITPNGSLNNGIINVESQGTKLNFVSSLIEKNKSLYFDIAPAKDTVSLTSDFKISLTIGNSPNKLTMPKEDYQFFDTKATDIMNNEKSVMTDLYTKYIAFATKANASK